MILSALSICFSAMLNTPEMLVIRLIYPTNTPATIPSNIRDESNKCFFKNFAISITGTGFPHPLGYSLTLLDGIPHGAACAVFEHDYIKANMRSELGRERLERFCALVGYSSDQIGELTFELAACTLRMSEEEIKNHVDLVKSAGNFANSPYVISYDEMLDIYRSHFAK